MNDHATPLQRLAQLKPVVCVEMPDWRIELLAVLVLLLGGVLFVTLVELAATMTEVHYSDDRAEFFLELALAEDKAPSVRLEPDGVGFKCSHYNIRREWEAAVLAQCQSLAGLLKVARTTP